MKKTILYLCFFFFAFSFSVAQEKTICELEAGKTNVYTKISAPSIYKDRMVLQKVATGKLVANYTSNVPSDVQTAVDTAVGIWNSLLNFSTQVDIDFDWVAMVDSNGNPNTKTLGNTGYGDPVFYNNKFYPPSLANALMGSDQNIADSEFKITLNSGFSWYKKLTGKPPANYHDLISVVLHEIGHGLGWNGSLGYYNGQGYWGKFDTNNDRYPMIFDEFVDDWAFSLIDTAEYPLFSVKLGGALTSKSLFFNGDNVEVVSPNNIKPKLYCPTVWNGGSSIYHLDEKSYPHGNDNSCMTPKLEPTEVIHSPGPIMLASLIDMGWTINRTFKFTSPKFDDSWAQGTHQSIEWDDTEASLVSIDLVDYLDGTVDHRIVENITSEEGHNVYSWHLINPVAGTRYKIKISDDTGNEALSEIFYYRGLGIKIDKPVITPTEQYFIEPMAIDIDSPTNGAEVRYTTNEDEVTDSSTIFTSLTITETTTIKARAYASGGESSSLAQKTYINGVEPIPITAQNRLLGGSTQQAGVKLWNDTDNIWEDNNSEHKEVTPDQSIILRFDSTYNTYHGKFYQTKEGTHTPNTAYLNYAIFNPYETNENTSFIGWRLEAYNTSLKINISEYPNLQWGDKYIKFSDPWLYDNTHPVLGKQNGGNLAEFHTRKTPFEPNTDTEFKGVLRDRNGITTGEPIYKIACPKQEIPLNGKIYNFVFTNWSTNDKASIENINRDTAKVVFGQNNSEVIANLKGIRLSNDANAFSNNSQRQTVRTHDGILHMVYESMGKAWYERSSDDGVTWELVGALNQGRNAKNPSIDFMWDVPSQAGDGYKKVSIIYDGEVGSGNEWGVVLENYFLVDNEYLTFGTSLLSDPTNLFTNTHSSNCIIALGVEQKFMTIWFNEQSELICGHGIITPMGGFGGWHTSYPKVIIADAELVGEKISLVSTKNYDTNNLSNYYFGFELKESGTTQSITVLSKLQNPDYSEYVNDSFVLGDFYQNSKPSISLITVVSGSQSKKWPLVACIGKNSTTDFTGYAKVIDWGNKTILSSTSFGSNVTSVQTAAPDYGEYGSNEALVVWKESNSSYLNYKKYQNNTFNEAGYLSEIGSCFSLCSGGENLSHIKPYVLKTNSLPYEIVKAELVSGIPSVITSNYTISSGTYQINGNLTVNSGVTLTIQEGVNLTFQNNSYLNVHGTLNVEGVSNNKVIFDFVSKNYSPTNGIRTSFYADVNINNAIIKNAYRGLNIQRSNLIFNNSEMKNCTFGLLMYYVDPGVTTNIITNSKFHHNYTGVYLYDNEYVEFSNNELYDNSYGLQVKYSDYNIFTNNEFDGNSTGAYLYYSNGKFSNNEFHGYQDVGLHCYRSSPTLAVVGVATGHNNIHENFVGIEAENNSNPFLGRVTCIDNGGYNIISNNIDIGIIVHNNCNIYAHKNYWETFASISAVYDNSSLDMSFPLSSPPSMSYGSGGSSEEEAFDLQFSQQLSKANNSSEELKISTSDIPVGYNKAWNIEWKLLYARNLITVKNYNAAAKICKSVITEYPDSSLSYLALDLLDKASIRGKRKTDFTQFVQSKASLKSKKQLFGSAELLLAVRETENKISALDRITDKYKGTSLVEFVLYDKFLHYLDEENNIKLAEATSAELGKLFPKSSSYYQSQKRLGKDVEKPKMSELKKDNSEEEVTEIPKNYELMGNYPNPFNPSTTISYALPYSSNVELTIYDITGKVVKTFNENVQSAGYQNIVWHGTNQNGSKVSSGVYFYRFKAASLENNGKVYEKTAKLLLLK